MSRAVRAGASVVMAAVVLHASSAGAQEVPSSSPAGDPAPDVAQAPAPAPPDDGVVPAPSATTLPPRRPPSPLGFRIDGGYRVQRFAALDAPGYDLGAAFGGRPTKNFAWWITPRFSRGQTDNGLGVGTWRIGGEIEAVIDPVRLGFGVALLHMSIDRATRPGDTIGAFGVEPRAFVQLDLAEWETGSLFLRGTAGGELTAKLSAFCPAITLGVELDVRGVHPR
ncbi:MAG: hypothetical protein JST00_04025 [Deltaproteobacteria bacterium]|nr:hypothetical protein [Deltaproteobacteria bacterium]